jgi:hypothetical protein
MTALSTLFERFLRERRYLTNVTPKTVVWYQTAFLAFTRTVVVSGPDDLNKPLLHDFVVGLRERGLSPVSCNTYLKAQAKVARRSLGGGGLSALTELRLASQSRDSFHRHFFGFPGL